MRIRTALLSIVPLIVVAATVSAQGDCYARPNSRGGTYISCKRNTDYAREQRRIAAEVRREAARVATRERAYAAQERARAAASERAFRARFDAAERAARIRERVNTRMLEHPRIYYRRW